MERRRELAAAAQKTGKARKMSKKVRREEELKKEHAKTSLPGRLKPQSPADREVESQVWGSGRER